MLSKRSKKNMIMFTLREMRMEKHKHDQRKAVKSWQPFPGILAIDLIDRLFKIV